MMSGTMAEETNFFRRSAWRDTYFIEKPHEKIMTVAPLWALLILIDKNELYNC